MTEPIVPPNFTIPTYGPRAITCLNCGGTGFVRRLGGDGMHYPIVCRGCNGSGKQNVR